MGGCVTNVLHVHWSSEGWSLWVWTRFMLVGLLTVMLVNLKSECGTETWVYLPSKQKVIDKIKFENTTHRGQKELLDGITVFFYQKPYSRGKSNSNDSNANEEIAFYKKNVRNYHYHSQCSIHMLAHSIPRKPMV